MKVCTVVRSGLGYRLLEDRSGEGDSRKDRGRGVGGACSWSSFAPAAFGSRVCPLRRRHGQCTGRQGRHDRVPDQRDLVEWVQIVSSQSVALAKSQIFGSLGGYFPPNGSVRQTTRLPGSV